MVFADTSWNKYAVFHILSADKHFSFFKLLLLLYTHPVLILLLLRCSN